MCQNCVFRLKWCVRYTIKHIVLTHKLHCISIIDLVFLKDNNCCLQEKTSKTCNTAMCDLYQSVFGFDPLPTQRDPLCTNLEYPFLDTNIQYNTIQYILILRGERSQNAIFFIKMLQKSVKSVFLFLTCFFYKILPAAQKIWPKQGLLLLWKNSKNYFGRPKKSRQIFWKMFENPPLPSRKS